MDLDPKLVALQQKAIATQHYSYREGWEGTKEEILLISNKLYWNKKKLMSKIQMSIQDKSLKETDKEMKIEKKHKCI